MARTSNRPLPQGQMSLRSAYSIVIATLVIGTGLLYLINLKCALLGLAAFISYVFMYTPMKSKSAWAVFVGAFPGAIPPFLGAIAATNTFGFLPGVLFFVQFTWQFPHFWAIAWVTHEDYKKAGYHLLPSASGKSKQSAFQILLYSLALIPFSLIARFLNFVERVGNKLPDPAIIFLFAMLLIWFLSWWFSGLSFDAIDPRTGEAIIINNMLASDSLATFLSSMVKTFTGFAPLGVVLVAF